MVHRLTSYSRLLLLLSLKDSKKPSLPSGVHPLPDTTWPLWIFLKTWNFLLDTFLAGQTRITVRECTRYVAQYRPEIIQCLWLRNKIKLHLLTPDGPQYGAILSHNITDSLGTPYSLCYYFTVRTLIRSPQNHLEFHISAAL